MNDQTNNIVPPTPPINTVNSNVTEQVKNSNSKVIILGTICIVAGLALGGGLGLFLKSKQPASSASSAAPATTNSNKPFLIGEVIPLTGDGASFGVPAKQASLVIEKEINEK